MTDGWLGVESLVRTARGGVEVAVAARLVGTGRGWEIDGSKRFPAASTIKTAILVALHREVDAGRLRLEEERIVSAAAKTAGSGVLAMLGDGLTLGLGDLATLMIAVSDNTASNLVLDAVGIDRVRATIADVGMRGTELNRRFLGRAPEPGEAENFTTAEDLVVLLAAIADGTAASPVACARMRATLALQQDRDRLARYLPAGQPFAGKSGWMPGLAHDSGLIETPAGLLAIAVLTRGFSDPYRAEETIGRIAVAAMEAVGAEAAGG